VLSAIIIFITMPATILDLILPLMEGRCTTNLSPIKNEPCDFTPTHFILFGIDGIAIWFLIEGLRYKKYVKPTRTFRIELVPPTENQQPNTTPED
jgi:hypothetical protein